MANMTQNTPSDTFSPVKEMSHRRELPEQLYIMVNDVAFLTLDHQVGSAVKPYIGDFHAKLEFACEDLTSDCLRDHLTRSNTSPKASRFISTFEDEGKLLT